MNNNKEVSETNKNFFSRIFSEMSEFIEEYKIQRPITSKIVMLCITGVLLAIILLLVHNQTIHSKAIAADDMQYVFQNNLVQNPSCASAKQFFFEVFNPSTVMGYYQPLAMISLMIDVSFGGSQSSIHVFHITSLCIHILNSFFVLLLLYLMFNKIWLAFIGGVLFGIHPVTIEEITWISERKSVLATFFLLLSLILYIIYVKSSYKKYLLSSIAVFILALLSKPIAVSLPIIILLLDYFWYNRVNFLTLIEKVPYFIISAIFTLVAYISQKNTASIEVLPQSLNILQIFLLICFNNIFYLWKLLIPTNLSSYYEFIHPISLSNSSYLIPAILTILLIIVFVLTYRRSKTLLLGYLFYIISILPTSGIIKVTDSIAYYRYAYFPFIGILICFMVLISNLSKVKKTQVIKYSIIIILFFLLSFGEITASNIYSSKWKDTETLFKYMLSVNPNSPTSLNTLGGEYYNQGKIDKSIEYFNQSLIINPSISKTYVSLASALCAKEQYNNALSLYEKALNIGLSRNDLALTYYNMGLIYEVKENYIKAKTMFETSIMNNPNFLDASFELAIILNELGNYDEAISICTNIIQDFPNNDLAYTYLGILYSKRGNYKAAVKQIAIAIDKNPNSSFSYYMLGNIMANEQKYKEASMCYDEAIKLDSGNIRIYKDYSKLFAQQGKFEEAIEILKTSINILPNSDAYNLLGMLYEDLGKYSESLDSYQRAQEINPETEDIQTSINRIKQKQH